MYSYKPRWGTSMYDSFRRNDQFKTDVSKLNLNEDAINAEYDADDVWVAAWAAFRLNGYDYIREHNYSADESKMLNRARMFSIVNKYEFITDEDREMGLGMREFNTRLTMVALTRQLNSFEQMVAEIVLKDKIKGTKDFSIIASLCPSYQRELDRRKKAEAINNMGEGNHVGKVKDRVTLNDVEVIHSKLSQTYLRYYNQGNYNGCLVGWWSDTGFDVGMKLNMTARIKEHCSWNGDNGAVPMTKLNYVSVR